jgi:hypothetical protein
MENDDDDVIENLSFDLDHLLVMVNEPVENDDVMVKDYFE